MPVVSCNGTPPPYTAARVSEDALSLIMDVSATPLPKGSCTVGWDSQRCERPGHDHRHIILHDPTGHRAHPTRRGASRHRSCRRVQWLRRPMKATKSTDGSDLRGPLGLFRWLSTDHAGGVVRRPRADHGGLAGGCRVHPHDSLPALRLDRRDRDDVVNGRVHRRRHEGHRLHQRSVDPDQLGAAEKHHARHRGARQGDPGRRPPAGSRSDPERVIDPTTQLLALALPGLAVRDAGLLAHRRRVRRRRLRRRRHPHAGDGGLARWC